MTFRDEKHDSFSERIDRAEVLGGNEGIFDEESVAWRTSETECGNSTSSIGTNVHGHLHRRRSSFTMNKNQNQSGGILETVAGRLKKSNLQGLITNER